MKTRIIMIVTLTVVALGLLLGLKIGRKNQEAQVTEQAAAETLIAKKVYNLIILDESGSMDGLKDVSVTGVNETLKTIRKAYEEFPQQEQYVTFALSQENHIMRRTPAESSENSNTLQM